MKKKSFARSKLISVRVDREILKELDVLAIQRERYRSELIDEALRSYIKKEEAFRKIKL